MTWETLPGAINPNNTAPRITGTNKFLHHINVAMLRGVTISYNANVVASRAAGEGRSPGVPTTGGADLL